MIYKYSMYPKLLHATSLQGADYVIHLI